MRFLTPFVHAQIHAPNPFYVDPALSQNYDFEILLTQVINFFIGFVGVIALVMLVLGGYYLLTSNGNEELVTKGRKSVMYAIIGIVVIVLSYAIVFTLTSSLRDLNGGRIIAGEGNPGLPLPPVFPPFPSPGSLGDLLGGLFGDLF